ncbi:MAG: hypothetical protein PW790_13790 [Parvibaculaceae bacterium]|nr:hypothetical protein [Parvibaculaceae bacterium]
MTSTIETEAFTASTSRRLFLKGVGGASLTAALGVAAAKARAEVILPRASSAIRPFRIAVPEADIADLKSRLVRTRFPEKETVSDWSQSVPLENPTPAELAALDGMADFSDNGVGYFRETGTRPQTVGYGLADSPVGLAMWIYEKFQAWTDNRGAPEDALTLDEMLDDISLYWFTDTGASSGRFYWENAPHGPGFNFGTIELPMAATVFPHEIWRAPRAWAKQMAEHHLLERSGSL